MEWAGRLAFDFALIQNPSPLNKVVVGFLLPMECADETAF
jgi:hypothetical protein